MQTTLSPDVYAPFKTLSCLCSLLLFSRSAVSNSLRPHGLQHTRLPHPSPSPVLKRLFLQKCRLSLESIFFVLLTSAFPCWRNRKYMVCSELDTSSAWRNTHALCSHEAHGPRGWWDMKQKSECVIGKTMVHLTGRSHPVSRQVTTKASWSHGVKVRPEGWSKRHWDQRSGEEKIKAQQLIVCTWFR